MNDSDKIACCLICSLAEVMKTCQTCAFKIGLEIKEAEKLAKLAASSNPILTQNLS